MAFIMKYLYYLTCKGIFFFEVSFQMIFLSCLAALFAWYMLRQPLPKKKSLPSLVEDEIIESFQPEELILNSKNHRVPPEKRMVTSLAGKHITVDGRVCLNLATHNYLGLVEDPEVKRNASASIDKYGVGSCGPRGFYGTVDVHLDLERKLAEFMGAEEACVYSYAFATMASAVPAYCKRGDVVFADEAVNFSIQKGLDASRSTVHYFKHNDMDDLRRILEEQRKLDKRNVKKAAKTRKFLIAEGVYINTGNICNLPELVKLRKEYKLRMLLDESVSFGTMGASGKGVVEYFGVPQVEVDLRIGSMEGSLASIGGFCCGASFIVEHQRLSGLGYCFSASLPPALAVAALTSLGRMQRRPDLFETLKSVSTSLHESLSLVPGLAVNGHPESPVKHMYLKSERDFNDEWKIISDIADYCLKENVAVGTPEYLRDIEKFPPRPSLRLTANVSLDSSDLDAVCRAITRASEFCIPA